MDNYRCAFVMIMTLGRNDTLCRAGRNRGSGGQLPPPPDLAGIETKPSPSKELGLLFAP